MLLGANAGAYKLRVGIEHHHEAHPLEVVPLGDHLRAHDDVDFARMHALKSRLGGVFRAHAVAVDAKHPRLRPERLDALLDALRARADGDDLGIAAARAALGHGIGGPAVVAHEGVARLVKHRKARAVNAAAHPAAARAGDYGRVAAAVDENENLLAARERLVDRLLDFGRKHARLSLADVDELH